jgi:hypothetical protein
MKNKIVFFTLIGLFALSACSNGSVSSNTLQSEIEYQESNAGIQEMVEIELTGDTMAVQGEGATVDLNSLVITQPGSYEISGTLNDGQIIVNSSGQGTVTLHLDSANITNSSGAAIYVIAAEEVVLELAEGSQNTLTDGKTYLSIDTDNDGQDAAIYSVSDLTIKGSGSLTVNANYQNGIHSKDDIVIESGNILVNAIADGIKGKDSVEILDGTLIVSAGSDGIQSSNNSDPEKGTVSIEGGILRITAGLDGIQAATNLNISAGNITIVSGGGSVNSSTQTGWDLPGRGMGNDNQSEDSSSTTVESMKGLKAGSAITIENGTIQIDSADDALNSNDSLTVNGGSIRITAGDDGLHANSTLTINEGTLEIQKSYEGIESSQIMITGGVIRVVSSDDGINVAGGNDSSAANGRPGLNEFSLSTDSKLVITGGNLVVNADGDGLDSNGSIEISGGQVIVNGPTNDGNGAVDYMGTFNINGGFIIAAGSSGMAQSASDTSTQYSLLYNFDDAQTKGTLIHIETDEDEELLTFAPGKDFQSILYSSPDLQNGMTYNLYIGGSSSGITVDGLYTDGLYTAGNQIVSFTVSGVVTKLGTAGSPMGGGKGGRGGGPGGGGGMQPTAQ